MAIKKQDLEAKAKKVEKVEAVEKPNPTHQEFLQGMRKEWEQMNLQERLASHHQYQKMIIASNLKQCSEKEIEPFTRQAMTKEQIDNSRPYNPSNGKCYSGDISMLLRAQAQEKGYKDPAFLTMKQANFMHGKLEPLKDEEGNVLKTENGKDKYPQGIKMAYAVEFEYKDKLNSKGEPIQATDKEGQPIFTQKGEPVYAKEKVFLKERQLVTTTLYHISQFKDLDMTQLKPRDLEGAEMYRKQLQDQEKSRNVSYAHIGLSKNATTDLENFANAEVKGLDYTPIQRQTKEKNNENTLLKDKDKGRE